MDILRINLFLSQYIYFYNFLIFICIIFVSSCILYIFHIYFCISISHIHNFTDILVFFMNSIHILDVFCL